MSRQPFLPQFAKVQFSYGVTCISDRPEFARIIGECVAVWAYVENEMGTLLGLLLDAKSEAAIEVFLNLRRSLNQREALAAAAKHKLTGDDLLAFEALMVVYKSVEASRNDIVHGCYGASTEMPDAILWTEMKNHVHFMTDVIAKEARKEKRKMYSKS